MAGGRPLKFKTPEELQQKINAYFTKCDSRTKTVTSKDGGINTIDWPIPYTIEGLAVALDTTRETILDYAEKDEYSDIISRAKAKILANKVEGGLDGTYNPKITEFMLKNNYKFKDSEKEKDDDRTVNINVNIKKKPKNED